VCKRSADPIKQLVADFPGKVKVYFRNNALAMHGRSKPAALAAWAAKNQGKFWQYHDKLFASGALDDASLEQHAKELGLDVAKWKADLADPKNSERLDQEAKWAESMGATGTPGFFVNGIRQVGWGSYMALKSMVQREVDKGEELAGQGTAKGQIAAKRIASQAAQNTKNEGEGAINGEQWASQLTAD
jgi:protein-disulfide isomerase